MAQLLAADLGAEYRQEQRQDIWHGARCDLLPPLRCAFRACVRRWSETHGLALLHEFSGAALRGAGVKRIRHESLEIIISAAAYLGCRGGARRHRSVAFAAV